MGRRRCAALVVIATIVCLSLSGVASQEEEEYFWHNGKAVHAGSFRTPHVSDLTPRLNTVRRRILLNRGYRGVCVALPRMATLEPGAREILLCRPRNQRNDLGLAGQARMGGPRGRGLGKNVRSSLSLLIDRWIDRSDAPDPDPDPDVSRTAALPPSHTHNLSCQRIRYYHNKNTKEVTWDKPEQFGWKRVVKKKEEL